MRSCGSRTSTWISSEGSGPSDPHTKTALARMRLDCSPSVGTPRQIARRRYWQEHEARVVVTLGTSDGHGAGAVLALHGRVALAVSEERLTRRKRERGFPTRSIEWILAASGVEP